MENTMANYDTRRNVTLELKLQVCRAKFTKLQVEAERLVTEVLGEHVNRNPTEQAERLREIMNELENSAPNLHQ